MAGTRSSARISGQPSSSPSQANPPPSSNGTKRKAESSPSTSKSKKGRKTEEKEQKTIEETLGGGDKVEGKDEGQDQPEDIEMKDAGSTGEGDKAKPDAKEQAEVENAHKPTNGASKEGHDGKPSCWFWSDTEKYPNDPSTDDSKTLKAGDSFKGKNKEGESKADPEKSLKDSRGGPGLNALDADKPNEPASKEVPHDDVHAEPENAPAHADNGNGNGTDADSGAVEESKERADAQPSNILEKGIIYFFTRGRVGIDDPSEVSELQRSHFVLRPLPAGAKLTDGTIEDVKNNRLLALPKKVWPKGPQDKFMAFVERAPCGLDELKENFFKGSEYSTKTTGVRHAPAVMPMAEGVYAITRAGGRDETHLAYMLTIPHEIGEIQEDIGLASKGSFVLSLKNPTSKGPAYASLPQKPEFPQE